MKLNSWVWCGDRYCMKRKSAYAKGKQGSMADAQKRGAVIN